MDKKIEDFYEKEKNILDKITEVYIFVLIILFPLSVDSTGFFKILECKYRVFLMISVGYVSISLITLIYYYIFNKVRYLKNIKLKKYQIAGIIFWVVNILSCFLSPYVKNYNLLVGVGRAEGLITISLYCLTFLMITIFGKFRKRYITYFSISSICVSLVAILQYIGFNPFNMYQDGIGTHNVSFMTTIGNIDFISAFYCITLSISVTAFIFLDENRKVKLIHLLSILMGFFIFIIINVMSGRVAFLVTLIIICPFILGNSKRLARSMIAFSMIILGLGINIIINPRYHYDIGKLTLDFQINAIAVAFVLITTVFWILAYMLYKNEYNLKNKVKIAKIIYGGIIILVFIATISVYFINFKGGTLYEVHELLHGNFDDNFGTYRVFLWKRAFKLVKEHPLIGSGPDTFAVRFMSKYTEDIKSLGELTINDTAANVYITMLINIGIIGLLSYILFLILQLSNGIKNRNKYSTVLLIGIMCYLVQDFFNLWVIIVTPIYWTLMAIHSLATDEKMILESGGKKDEKK